MGKAEAAAGKPKVQFAGDPKAPSMQPLHKHKLRPAHPMFEQGVRVLEHGHYVTDTFPVSGWTHDHPDADAYTHPAHLRRPSR